ncbi:MAG TPA: hypothetical protein PL132_06475 [Prolixibacteraceae bacterium]|nr:hypothetical protein [Prolixibacteraceae bacterium]
MEMKFFYAAYRLPLNSNLEGLAISNLKEQRQGADSISPIGKPALIFLKLNTAFSDRELEKSINGNLYYQSMKSTKCFGYSLESAPPTWSAWLTG